MIDISILIPTYNRVEFIEECILSALNQDYKNYEIIIVDNKSNDGTWEICVNLSKQHSRIKLFRNENNIGPVLNWLRCAQEASGKFSKILFSDDTLDKNCLSNLKHIINNNNIGFSFCAARIGTTIHDSSIYYSNSSVTKFNMKTYVKMLLSGNAPVSPGAILLRTKDLIKALNIKIDSSIKRPYNSHGAGPDLLISLQTLLDYKYVVGLSYPLVFFRSHKNSLTITDKNFEISDGYASTWCYFTKKNMSLFYWSYCVSVFYLDHKNKRGSKYTLKEFCKMYNGKGSIIELCMISFFIKYIS
jgi:glycosyltransferase involved in cell wall biosynthesis